MEHLTIEAPSVAAFATALDSIPRETRAMVTATEHGTPWAVIRLSQVTDTRRSAFPCDATGVGGDTRKRGQAGVLLDGADHREAARTVIERARRMFATAPTTAS